MSQTSTIAAPARFSRRAFFLALVMAMAAITLHLAAFTAQAGQASLSWSAPTNPNGSALSGVAGYKLYYGTNAGSLSQSLDVGNVTSYTLSNLPNSTLYYFAVTDYTSGGSESPYSNQVSLTTQGSTTPPPPPPASTFSLTASAGSGGAISPSGTVAISSGLSQSFAITPNSGYKVASVTVDGTSVGAVSSYNFSSVSANHTISATFAANSAATYTVTASAGTGGSISPSGTATVTAGASQSYTVTPATGYQVAALTVDGASVGAVSSYSFTNVGANHTIAASFTSTSTSTSTGTAGGSSFAVNCGGAQVAGSGGITYLADAKYSGGSVSTTTSGISGTNEAALYQSERYGNFSYSVPVTNGNYTVTLKFAEIYFTSAGQRVFNVAINGQNVLSNLDIYARAGNNAAYDFALPVTVTNGTINITFTSVVNNAKVSAINIAPAAATTAGKLVFATNSGGSQVTCASGTVYQADAQYSGGTANSSTNAISGTNDGAVYQSERYGNFSYNIPLANGNYSVTLKFAEVYFTSAGQRVFNVTMNGQTVISNLDLYAKAGANAAYDVVLPVTVTNGTLNLGFASVVNNAKVSAIVVKTS